MLDLDMLKLAKLEETEMTDSKSGKAIRISTTTRLIYRKIYPELESVRNARLNILIAKDFVKNASNVLHYFRLGKKEQTRTESAEENISADVAEIRGNQSFFFVSAIRDNYIDILTVQTSWLKPKYRGSQEDPIALGEE